MFWEEETPKSGRPDFGHHCIVNVKTLVSKLSKVVSVQQTDSAFRQCLKLKQICLDFIIDSKCPEFEF